MSSAGRDDDEKPNNNRRRQALANLKSRRGLGSADGSSSSGEPHQAPQGTVKAAAHRSEDGVEDIQPDNSVVSAEPAPIKAAASIRKVKQLAWICQDCSKECVPIRPESRCLCGHRLKDHEKGDAASTPFKCKNARCTCKHFFFIVAEGSWILRCRCKHKHTEHDPITHRCTKASCSCSCFDSPWVCNCNHPWGSHKQVVVEREVMTLEAMMAAANAQQGGSDSQLQRPQQEHHVLEVQANQFDVDVNRFDQLKRGLD